MYQIDNIGLIFSKIYLNLNQYVSLKSDCTISVKFIIGNRNNDGNLQIKKKKHIRVLRT